MNETSKLEPWQWPETHWRGLVNQVRAGKTYRPKTWKGDARSRCRSIPITRPTSCATAANRSGAWRGDSTAIVSASRAF